MALIVRDADHVSAARQLDTLPFVEIGIMTMELSPIEPVDIDAL